MINNFLINALQKCCLSGAGKSNTNKSTFGNGYDGQKFEINSGPLSTTPFSTKKSVSDDISFGNHPKIKDLLADPFFITYNMSLDPFCTRQSCKDNSGIYQYLIRLDKTIQFRNIVINLK